MLSLRLCFVSFLSLCFIAPIEAPSFLLSSMNSPQTITPRLAFSEGVDFAVNRRLRLKRISDRGNRCCRVCFWEYMAKLRSFSEFGSKESS